MRGGSEGGAGRRSPWGGEEGSEGGAGSPPRGGTYNFLRSLCVAGGRARSSPRGGKGGGGGYAQRLGAQEGGGIRPLGHGGYVGVRTASCGRSAAQEGGGIRPLGREGTYSFLRPLCGASSMLMTVKMRMTERTKRLAAQLASDLRPSTASFCISVISVDSSVSSICRQGAPPTTRQRRRLRRTGRASSADGNAVSCGTSRQGV